MPIPIVTVDQMRQWEAATWALGQKEQAVIERAGKAVADCAARLARPGSLVLVVAGKGHNGDDARAAARHLRDREVVVVEAVDPGAALVQLETLQSTEPALLIDGLFGIGLDRPLSGEWLNLVETINAAPCPILSVDVPSGLNADTGEALGGAVRATVTLTLGAPKRGLVRIHAAQWVGRLEVAPDIGLAPCSVTSPLGWTLASEFAHLLPPRSPQSHKGTYGHLVIVAGSVGYHGAAVLCARGALRAQPGLVSVVTEMHAYLPVASQLQAAMVRPWRPSDRWPDGVTALVVGPGLANPEVPHDLAMEMARLWQNLPIPMVADASALNWLPRGATPSGRLRLITPHPGEAARMLNCSVQDVQNDRVEAVHELSRRFGDCWVILKGHHTCIGRAGGAVHLNSSGNPYLAQGGAGDILAGYLGGLLAQPGLRPDLYDAARYAVWQHGATADRLTETRRNWGMEELLEELGNVPAHSSTPAHEESTTHTDERRRPGPRTPALKAFKDRAGA